MVRLPKDLKGKEFEEFVAAIFQAAGFYVERNITERGKEEVLELDIVLMDYRQEPCPETKLVEAKARGWGFGDIFKVRGWMCYLGRDQAYFIVHERPEHFDFFQKKASGMNIELVVVEDFDNAASDLSHLTGTDTVDDMDIACWRWAYWAERAMLRRLKDWKKSVKDKRCYRVIDQYYFSVNSGIFFSPTVVNRLWQLYMAFQTNPHISAKTGHELTGEDFNGDHHEIPRDVWQETYWQCKYNPVQISTFVEHRARLAILKNAVDFELRRRAGVEDGTETWTVSGEERQFSVYEILPDTFKQGLEQIQGDEWFAHYPVFWQWFLWLFGGFILLDYKEREYELLADKTGIPVGAVDRAFEVYELLFPQDGGWFAEPGGANVRFIKVFSMPFRGVGANYRRLRYGGTEGFDGLQLTGQHTLSDLILWNNLLVEVLPE